MVSPQILIRSHTCISHRRSNVGSHLVACMLQTLPHGRRICLSVLQNERLAFIRHITKELYRSNRRPNLIVHVPHILHAAHNDFARSVLSPVSTSPLRVTLPRLSSDSNSDSAFAGWELHVWFQVCSLYRDIKFLYHGLRIIYILEILLLLLFFFIAKPSEILCEIGVMPVHYALYVFM